MSGRPKAKASLHGAPSAKVPTGINLDNTNFPKREVASRMVEHTGQSSQLFPVATGRNAQFLATVAKGVLVRQVEAARISA